MAYLKLASLTAVALYALTIALFLLRDLTFAERSARVPPPFFYPQLSAPVRVYDPRTRVAPNIAAERTIVLPPGLPRCVFPAASPPPRRVEPMN
jgi:hypothetical protein